MLTSLALALVVAAPDAGAAAPRPARRPVVAVLYFDNLTGDRDFDVFQKGLADMMVTDLVASDAVEVVEREKLQAVLDELRLQRSKYFDPATAVRLGRLVGASHAVTGAVQEVKDRLRLSVRVIDLTTDRVPVAQEVFGPKDKLFELQQRLVELLLASLNVKLGVKATVTPVAAVDTLLSYSRAVDAADRGDLVAASARLAELLQRSPTFELGQDRRLAFAKRLRAAGDARRGELEKIRRQLLERATAVVEAPPRPVVAMGDLEAARHLTYRVVRAQCLALALKAQLTPRPVHNIPEGREVVVRPLVAAYREALLALDKDLAEWRGKWRWLPDPADKAALAQLELGEPPALLLANVPGVVRRWVGQLALLGRVELTHAGGFVMRPTPCELEPGTVDEAANVMGAAARLLALRGDEELVATLDALAQGLSLSGRREAAVHQWQELLERYPKSKQFEQVERHLKDALDLTPAALAAAEEDRALAKAVGACDAGAVQASLEPVVARRFREAGLAGVKPLLAEVGRACGQSPAFAPALAAAALLGADAAERHGDCGLFERYAEQYGKLRPEKVARLRADHATCQ